MEADIRKDVLYQVPIVDGDSESVVVVNAKYDRIDVYRPLGIWILKCLDDEEGMIQAILDESQATKLADWALLPIVERQFLFESEHSLYLDAIAARLDSIWNDDK